MSYGLMEKGANTFRVSEEAENEKMTAGINYKASNQIFRPN